MHTTWYLSGARLVTAHADIANAALVVENARIAAVGGAAAMTPPAHARALDVSKFILVPGFIDLQFNGGFGHDFTAQPETIWQVAQELPRHGVAAFLPTIITAPFEKIQRAQSVLQNGAPENFRGATPLGLHLEGPFLNPQKRGAHNVAYMRLPDASSVRDWTPQNFVRLVTLAPELDGAREVIRALCENGVVVSAGHSMATFEEAQRAFDAGIAYGTHLFNAMPPLDHRAPGLAGALLNDARVTVGIIPDAIHVHPALVDLALRQKTAAHLNVVTDAMAALGMTPGKYLLGDFTVQVDETSARLEDGRLAGSILNLRDALVNLMRFTRCALSDALATMTTTPARVLHLENERGDIAPGYFADLVLLTADLRVAATMVQGQWAWYDAQELAL
ncbi:MAG: N-acetylglucosamine-6-phosphate deacetylase [Anaerolineae bacterium]|nr:N-acetylglucosamine-6-phosphate deacetylase [Anaerolineae bacterium]